MYVCMCVVCLSRHMCHQLTHVLMSVEISQVRVCSGSTACAMRPFHSRILDYRSATMHCYWACIFPSYTRKLLMNINCFETNCLYYVLAMRHACRFMHVAVCEFFYWRLIKLFISYKYTCIISGAFSDPCSTSVFERHAITCLYISPIARMA
jgi:hypothetical protein